MEILYHYCSTEAFLSIISSKKIRLSSLSQSNDSMEGTIAKSLIRDMAKRDGLSDFTIETISKAIDTLTILSEHYGFCLSDKEDMLSQWRGYANDGHGFAIGFDKDYLNKIGSLAIAKSKEFEGNIDFLSGNSNLFLTSLAKVIYSEEDQKNKLRQIYETIKSHAEKGAFQPPRLASVLGGVSQEAADAENQKRKAIEETAYAAILALADKLFIMKSDAFAEESESRLIGRYIFHIGYQKLGYSSRQDQIIPFFELDIDPTKNPIKKILIGPKNKTPTLVIQKLLQESLGEDIKIKKSAASYR